MITSSNSFLVSATTPPAEIKRKIKRARTFASAVKLVIVVVLGVIMQLAVAPRLGRLYEDFNLASPPLFSLALYIFIIGVVLWGLLLLSLIQEEPSYLTTKTKEGYLIITPQASGRQRLVSMASFIFMGLLIGFFLYIYLSPYLLITSQF